MCLKMRRRRKKGEEMGKESLEKRGECEAVRREGKGGKKGWKGRMFREEKKRDGG